MTGTQNIETARIRIDDTYVTLIDTPGFDDTDRTDADILKLIADYLVGTYQNNVLLTGLILLQPISGNRVQGSERRRTRLFEKVCGSDAYKNIVIATTMWNCVESEQIGQARMTERMRETIFWGAMVDQGAQVIKHDNTLESARNIIKMLINKQRVPLQMQEELVQNGGRIGDTSAGQQLDAELGEKSAELTRQLEELEKDLIQNAAENDELRKRLEDTRREREQLQESKVSLSLPFVALLRICDTLAQTPRGLRFWQGYPFRHRP
jgi:hypothetical protein